MVDTLFAIVRRTVGRRGFSVADRDHLHHRLMRLGHGHRRAVMVLWLWTALLSAFVLFPTYTGRGDAIVPIGIAALALVLFTIFHPRFGYDTVAVDEEELDRLRSSEPSGSSELTLGVLGVYLLEFLATVSGYFQRTRTATISGPTASRASAGPRRPASASDSQPATTSPRALPSTPTMTITPLERPRRVSAEQFGPVDGQCGHGDRPDHAPRQRQQPERARR